MTLKQQLVHVKDRIGNLDETCAVYKINCESCPNAYIGETGRNVSMRMNEHKKDIEKKKDTSQIYQHIGATGHTFDFDGVKILHKNQNMTTRRILESYYTHADGNSINRAFDVNQAFVPIVNKFMK